MALSNTHTNTLRNYCYCKKRLISKIYFFIFPFFKDLAVLYREKYIKGRVQIQNFAYMKGI
jgi:hypothetical protein